MSSRPLAAAITWSGVSAADGDDLYAGKAGAKLGDRFHALLLWHQEICNHEVNRVAEMQLHGYAPVRGFDFLVPLFCVPIVA